MTVLIRKHTDAVIAALEAAGLTVGDADAEGLTPPYAVVYKIDGGEYEGSFENPYEDAELIYQVTCVGVTREQAEWVADKAMVLLNGLTVADRRIALVSPEGGPGTRPDRDVTPHVWYSTPRFRLKSTPS